MSRTLSMKALSLAGVLLSMVALSAEAQVAVITGAKSDPDSANAAGVIRRMSADLSMLARGQAAWYKSHDRYGKALRRTEGTGVVVDPSAGVRLELLYVTTKGWTARATHGVLKGKSCVVYGGDIPPSRMPKTTADRATPGRSGVPVCDVAK